MNYRLITYNNGLSELIKEIAISAPNPITLVNKDLVIESIEDDLLNLLKSKSIGVLREGVIVDNFLENAGVISVMAKTIFKHLLSKSSIDLIFIDLTNDNEILIY